MPLRRLLIANRGEVAVRVARAASALGLTSVAVHASDEADALHVARCDEAVALPGNGPAAYLDVAAVVQAAVTARADGLHPGYGFLSEDAGLARACADAGVLFLGPDPDVLEVLGDKLRARELATSQGVPVVPGTSSRTDLEQAQAFLASLGDAGARTGMVVKAVMGGGGRGMRVVRRPDELPEALERCRSEALAATGTGDVYVEQRLSGVRHVEVQVLGDGSEVVHLWDRDCSVQRDHQKLLEIAPCPGLDPDLRARLLTDATRLLGAVHYRGLGTVEFLVGDDGRAWFLEVNPRLQVEHTVTEQVLGLDLVQAQLRTCAGETLADLGLRQEQVPAPSGSAVQVRLNAEVVGPDGRTLPQAGTLTAVDLPAGPGVRVDTGVRSGSRVSPRYDSLLAKVVVSAPVDLPGVLRLARRALAETRIEGVATNLPLQRALLADQALADGRCRTDHVDTHLGALLATAAALTPAAGPVRRDPVTAVPEPAAPEGATPLRAPTAATVVAVEVAPGDAVVAGRTLVVLEAMKMQHVVQADGDGEVVAVAVQPGATVGAGDLLAWLRPTAEQGVATTAREDVDPDLVRPDLEAVLHRRGLLLDAERPEAVARRHATGLRTARENVADLVDEGSFVEYGGLAVAAQRRRRTVEDLIAHTPADGLVTGIGTVNGHLFPDARSRCAVLAYDYTVLAGTQGWFNHQKTDRLLDVARRQGYPVVLFAEGGGGRPGDVDPPKVGGLDTRSFSALGELSGTVPTVGIVAGRCFAGNAALLGTCDVVIATAGANIGMGGPAMIEGGGLGVFRPDEIGPVEVQTRNGVVDLAVADEAEAVAVARRYLSYFQGDVADVRQHDQRRLRHLVPEDRKQVYDVRRVVDVLCDVDSVLELRRGFGTCVITALVRLGGRPTGLIANDPAVLGGAIDADGADKTARFLQLCDVFGLPVVSLCDTPGFMVGPASEETATVRHFSRLFVRGANLTVPLATVVLRKSYGLGAMAMAGGSLALPVLTVAWPTGEFGGMGLEGAVRLGYRRELEAIEDPQAREQRYQELVAHLHAWGGALNTAMHLEIDDVVDPADTRALLLASLPPVERVGWTNPRVRTSVDTW